MKRFLVFLLVVASVHAADAPFGDIPANLNMSTSQSVRRNAANNGFEAYTPSATFTGPFPWGGNETGHGDSDYTILSTDKIVYTNASFTALRTWTLPAANTVSAGYAITVIDRQGTLTQTNRLKILRTGSTDLIYPPNAGLYEMTQAYQGVTLESDGSGKWYAWAVQPGNITGGSSGTFAQQSWTSGVWAASLYTLPTAIGTSGKMLQSNGTNVVFSAPTWPIASTASGKIVQDNGTNYVESSFTMANPGTAGNVLTSDGFNWLSSAPSGGGGTPAGGAGDVQYNSGSSTFAASSNFDYGTDNANALTVLTSNTTNGVDYPLVLDHENTASPASGTGVGINYKLRDTTTANTQAGYSYIQWTTATHGNTETAYVIGGSHQGNLWNNVVIGGVGSMHVGGNIAPTTAPTTAGVINMDAGFQFNGVATSGSFAQGGGSIYAASAYKLPTSIGADQTAMTSNGTDVVFSAPDGSKGNSTASATSWTPDFNTYSMEIQTALAGAVTINAPTFTGSAAKNGTRRTLRIKDNGSARGITWTTGSSGAFRASTDLALPTTTTAGKTLYLRFYWNNDDSRWDFMSKLDNF